MKKEKLRSILSNEGIPHIVIHNSELLRRHVKNLFTFKHLRMGL